MGSQMSSHKSSDLIAADQVPRQGLLTATNNQVVGRKRPREEESVSSINCDDGETKDPTHTSSTDEQPSLFRSFKKRRLSFSRPSLPPVLDKMCRMFLHSTCRHFTRTFLMKFIECVIENRNTKNYGPNGELRDLLISMLDCFQKHDTDLLRRGWFALAIVCGCNQHPGQLPARKSMEEDAAVVSMVMQHCDAMEAVQLLGCRAMRVLVCCGDPTKKASETEQEHWESLHRAGALRALTNAMQKCPNERTLQGLCASFIAMIIKEVGEPARRDLRTDGGIEIVLQACRDWEHDDNVLHTLLCVIYQLSSRSTRQRLIDLGTIGVLSQCIVPHYDNRGVIELILGSLNQLSITSENNFAGHSLVPRLVVLLKKYPNNENVQFFGILLLRAAGRTDQIPLEEAIERIIAAMKQFPDTSGILFFCGALMWQILELRDDGQRTALKLVTSSGCLELLTAALHRHRNVYGLAPLVHMIMLYAWENRPMENEAASQAFGGSVDVVTLVSKLDDDAILGIGGRGDGNDDDE